MRYRQLTFEDMNDRQREVAKELSNSPRGEVRGPFQYLLLRPALAEATRQLADCIRYDNILPAKLRELAIIIAARHWSSHYEWQAHRAIAEREGLAKDICDAIAEGRRPSNMCADEQLVYEACRELLANHGVSDGTYAAIVERFGADGAVDALATVSFYSYVALMINAGKVPVPDGAQQLPDLHRLQ